MALKVGIIGLGKVGRLRLRICRAMDNIEVVAVADSSKRALQVAKKMGVKKLYNSYNELLRLSDVDVVVISLPNFLHKESIVAAIEADKHVFVEKPLAMTSVECEEVMHLADKRGVKLMVGHNYRFLDCVKKVKSVYERGIIGDVELSTFELVYDAFASSLEPTPMSEWYFDVKKTGGWLLDAGYHLIDLFQWFFGDAEVLYAHLDSRFHLSSEDHAIIVLGSKNGTARGVLNVGWFSKLTFPRFNFRVILHGTAGFVSTEQFVPRNLYIHAVKEGVKNVLKRALEIEIRPLTYTYFYSSYAEELRHFFNCLKNDEEPIVTARDAFDVVKTIENIYCYHNEHVRTEVPSRRRFCT